MTHHHSIENLSNIIQLNNHHTIKKQLFTASLTERITDLDFLLIISTDKEPSNGEIKSSIILQNK